MVGARTPAIIVGDPGSGRWTVADALRDALPADAVAHVVERADEFAWLPEAAALGWRPAGGVALREGHEGHEGREGNEGLDPRRGVLVVRDLADPGGGPSGDRARVLVRALSLGYGMLATMPGRGLDDMLERLHDPSVGTTEDERTRLGLVIVMAPRDPTRGPRLAAVHYLRPLALDSQGHLQRLPPAVVATWSGTADRWDHFAWGVMPELAGRAGVAPRELEREQALRAAAFAR
jgi:hypothetical protein